MTTGQADSREHAAIAGDLPWFANGTLPPPAAARVAEHVEHCESCRSELAALERLAQCMRPADVVERVPGAALSRVMARIEAHDARRIRHADLVRSCALFARRWRSVVLPVAVAVQAVVILALIVRTPASEIAGPEGPALYRTLTDPAAVPRAGPRLRIVFAADTTVTEMHALLDRVGGQVVAGPNPSGALTIELAARDASAVTRALAELRAGSGVLFVEVMTPSADPSGPGEGT